MLFVGLLFFGLESAKKKQDEKEEKATKDSASVSSTTVWNSALNVLVSTKHIPKKRALPLQCVPLFQSGAFWDWSADLPTNSAPQCWAPSESESSDTRGEELKTAKR